MEILNALILGVVEGLTEFLPISSTGHLILASDLLGANDERGKVFDIAIQTGAILAVIWEYRARFFRVDPACGRRLRPVEKPRALCGARSADVRGRPRRRLRLRFHRHPLADRLRRDPRLPAVRVVPDRVRRGGAADGLLRMG